MERIITRLLQDFEQGKMTRRQLIQSLALAATAGSAVPSATAADTLVAKALSINHVRTRWPIIARREISMPAYSGWRSQTIMARHSAG
jgi:hypothetical protein